MTDDIARLQRQMQAMAAANRALAEQVEIADRHRRAALADEWIADLAQTPADPAPTLAKRGDGAMFLLEGERRRAVRSGLLAAALEARFGTHRAATDDELDALEEGPPVEVLEALQGAPFVIVGGQRLPLRGLPLPHPLPETDLRAFPEGDQLDLGGLRPPPPPTVSTEQEGPPLPNFLIIGAQKSATRWLRSNLDAHPDVFTAPGEPGFFNDERRLKQGGVAWYRSQFEGWDGQPFVGESTPGYLMWTEGPDEVAHRIARMLPNVRLLAVLRNPVDRARSAMMHHVIKGRLPPDSDLLDLVQRTPPERDQLGLISGGWYAASLAPYVELFGDQLLVLLHDDVAADPAAAYGRAVGHIGAAQREVPVGVARVRESQESLLPNVRRLTRQDRETLYEFFREDIARLEKLLDRDLSAWAPDAEAEDPADDAPPDDSPVDDTAPAAPNADG